MQPTSSNIGAIPSATPASITRELWGALRDGRAAELFTLANDHLRVRLTNFGGRLVSIEAPDAQGHRADVLLGYDDLAGYESDRKYFGATIGRLANRLAKGEFQIDGTTYHVPINNGPNALHGGPAGFHCRLWSARTLPSGVELTYLSADGEMGFPGNLSARVQFLLEGASLRLEFFATTDKTTPVSLTNHAYFNLTGSPRNNILGHQVTLHADHFLPVDETLIPTGELRPVQGTPFDFTTPHTIGERIEANDEQLHRAGGYDHTVVLRSGSGLALAAQALEPESGRTITVHTTQPGMQFYSGNFLDGSAGKAGIPYNRRTGFCLETQHFPDSPNHPNFPTVMLTPGEELRSTTIFTFGTKP